jgi:hypothetical protein
MQQQLDSCGLEVEGLTHQVQRQARELCDLEVELEHSRSSAHALESRLRCSEREVGVLRHMIQEREGSSRRADHDLVQEKEHTPRMTGHALLRDALEALQVC